MNRALPFRCLFSLLLLLPTVAWAQRQRVAAGYAHTVAIKADGTLWAWGANAFGQAGDGTTTPRPTPQRISAATDWVSVSAGASHTLALRRDGTLWAWGFGGNGRLGVISNTYFSYLNRPTQVGTDTTWVEISAGSDHSLALRRNGTLWAWGANYGGELGNGTINIGPSEPTQVGAATDWLKVSAGTQYSLAIRQNGTLWAWGRDYDGRLGLGGASSYVPMQVGGATDWVAVSAGSHHALGLRRNSGLWGWGLNDTGQLLPLAGTSHQYDAPQLLSSLATWTSVRAGDFHSLATRADGSLWAWGSDDVGALGVGRQTVAHMQPVAAGAAWLGASVGSGHSVALRADGSVWTWGYNPNGEVGTLALTLLKVAQPLQVGSLTAWARLAAGRRHTAAIRADSSLWLWGANNYGQLGEPVTAANRYRAAPTQLAMGQKWLQVACGDDCTMAIRADGTLWAWGANGRSQLGLGPRAASASAFFTPQQVGTATGWARLALGDAHTLALRADGTLWAWGSNTSGQTGNGSVITYDDVTEPLQIGPETTWQAVAAGYAHSIALRTDGSLWSWGNNGSGQLGNGSTTARNTPGRMGTATWASVAAGLNHNLAVQPNGTLWSWGYNLAGQLGDGTSTDRLSPAQIGNAVTWTKVAAGVGHSAALRADGTAWEWGAQVYDLDRYNPPAGVPRPAMVAGAGWAAISAGYAHSVALRGNGTLSAWGVNGASQLGNPIFTDVPVLIPLVAGALAVRPGGIAGVPLAVFPNPARHVATLATASSTEAVVITDLLGRAVRHLPAGTRAFSVETLAPGLYLVRQGHRSTQLVVE